MPTLDLSPHHASAQENFGCSLKKQGRLVEAEELLRSAGALYPDNMDIRWNHALALLMSQNYQECWVAYEARHALAIKPQSLPSWVGLSGQQGYIVIQAPPRMRPLMRSLTTKAEITDNAKAATGSGRAPAGPRLALGRRWRYLRLVSDPAPVSSTNPRRLEFRFQKHRNFDKGRAGMSASLTTLSSFRSVESVEVEFSPGELIDKITILKIEMQ